MLWKEAATSNLRVAAAPLWHGPWAQFLTTAPKFVCFNSLRLSVSALSAVKLGPMKLSSERSIRGATRYFF